MDGATTWPTYNWGQNSLTDSDEPPSTLHFFRCLVMVSIVYGNRVVAINYPVGWLKTGSVKNWCPGNQKKWSGHFGACLKNSRVFCPAGWFFGWTLAFMDRYRHAVMVWCQPWWPSWIVYIYIIYIYNLKIDRQIGTPGIMRQTYHLTNRKSTPEKLFCLFGNTYILISYSNPQTESEFPEWYWSEIVPIVYRRLTFSSFLKV